MLKLPLTLILFTCLAPWIHAELPREAREAIDRYEQYAEHERTALKTRLAEKRGRLVFSLMNQMTAHMKSGNQAAADAIREAINRLNEDDLSHPHRKPWQEVRWRMDHPDVADQTMLVTFHSDGTASQFMEQTQRNYNRRFRWKETGPGAVEYWWGDNSSGSLMKFTFSPNSREALIEHHKRGKTMNAKRIETP